MSSAVFSHDFPGSVDDWEVVIGRQVRELRLRKNLRQLDLARAAQVSPSALQNLERGRGSSVKTLVAVARALGRPDWLAAFAPPVTISPMQMLRERRQSSSPRQRARVRAQD